MAETPPVPTWSTTLAVFVGGTVGTSCRHILHTLLPTSDHGSWLIINSFGCLILGYATERTRQLTSATHWLRRTTPWWGTGLLGSFTSYSAIAALANHPGWLVPHLLAGIVAAVLGIATAQHGRQA